MHPSIHAVLNLQLTFAQSSNVFFCLRPSEVATSYLPDVDGQTIESQAGDLCIYDEEPTYKPGQSIVETKLYCCSREVVLYLLTANCSIEDTVRLQGA